MKHVAYEMEVEEVGYWYILSIDVHFHLLNIKDSIPVHESAGFKK